MVSASDWTSPISQVLSTSLNALARPGSAPTRTVFCPLAAKTGSHVSSALSGPATMTSSSPFSAGSFVPDTGASTRVTPVSSASSAARSVAATPIVLICTQIAFSLMPFRAPSGPVIADSTASQSASMVRTTSELAADAAGVLATVAPSLASDSAFSRVRFQTLTLRPASSRSCAMALPMIPVPSTATFMGSLVPACDDDKLERVAEPLEPPAAEADDVEPRR
jgi:hypothetical protein